MYVIYLRQLHEYLTSFRAQIGFAVVITFFLLSGVLSALRITQTQLDDAESQRNVAAKLASVETVQQGARTTLQARNSPTATEFMSEGGLHWFWGTVSTTAESGRNMGFGQARSRNYWMGSFERLDWTFIVRLIFSFLCVVLAYDSISGEAERGTLRLMLTCPISRIRVAVAKYGAQLTVLGVLFTIGSMMSLVILMLMGSVQLSWTLVWKYFLYEAAVLVFLSQFLWFAIGISALVARSSSALVLLSLVWTSANIILPQSAYLLAMQTVEVPNRMRDAPSVYVRDVRQSLVASGGGLRDPIVAITDDYVIERRYARLVNEAEQEADQLRQLWLHRLMDRYAAARAITLLSPAYAFQYVVEALLGTGVAKRQNFLEQGLDYRDQIRSLLRERDAQDPQSPHVMFLPDFMSGKSLDGSHMPHFVESQLTTGEGLRHTVVPCVILLAETLAAFLFGLWAVRRREITDMTAG